MLLHIIYERHLSQLTVPGTLGIGELYRKILDFIGVSSRQVIGMYFNHKGLGHEPLEFDKILIHEGFYNDAVINVVFNHYPDLTQHMVHPTHGLYQGWVNRHASDFRSGDRNLGDYRYDPVINWDQRPPPIRPRRRSDEPIHLDRSTPNMRPYSNPAPRRTQDPDRDRHDITFNVVIGEDGSDASDRPQVRPRERTHANSASTDLNSATINEFANVMRDLIPQIMPTIIEASTRTNPDGNNSMITALQDAVPLIMPAIMNATSRVRSPPILATGSVRPRTPLRRRHLQRRQFTDMINRLIDVPVTVDPQTLQSLRRDTFGNVSREYRTLHPGEEPYVICPITRENFVETSQVTILDCGHYFMSSGIAEWLSNHAVRCPACNRDVRDRDRDHDRNQVGTYEPATTDITVEDVNDVNDGTDDDEEQASPRASPAVNNGQAPTERERPVPQSSSAPASVPSIGSQLNMTDMSNLIGSLMASPQMQIFAQSLMGQMSHSPRNGSASDPADGPD